MGRDGSASAHDLETKKNRPSISLTAMIVMTLLCSCHGQRPSAPTPSQGASPPTSPSPPCPNSGCIFIVDAAGHVRGSIAYAYGDVMSAVAELPQGERFNVLITQQGEPSRMSKSTVRATPQTRRELAVFLDDLHPQPTPDLALAIKEAVRERPADVWIVTDGSMDDDERVVSEAAIAHDADVRVNTVLHFAYDVDGRKVADRIAVAGGGICLNEYGRVVTVEPDTDGVPPPGGVENIFRRK